MYVAVEYCNSVNICTNLLFVSRRVYGNKIAVNVNVRNVKLTVNKFYGKKHVGAVSAFYSSWVEVRTASSFAFYQFHFFCMERSVFL